jgi:hypothetical protein
LNVYALTDFVPDASKCNDPVCTETPSFSQRYWTLPEPLALTVPLKTYVLDPQNDRPDTEEVAVTSVTVNIGINVIGGRRIFDLLTVTWRVAVFAPHRAVNVNVVFGATFLTTLPGVPTLPMPWSISTESAFVTAPHANVTFPVNIRAVGDTVNVEIAGAPLQAPDGGTGVGGTVVGSGGAEGSITLITTVRAAPKAAPPGALSRH